MVKSRLISGLLPSLSVLGLCNIPSMVSAKPAPTANVSNTGNVNEANATKIKAVVEQYLIKKDPSANPADMTYKVALADLNGDQYQDALVLMTGSYWCGNAGCNLLVFKGTDKTAGFQFVSDSTLVRDPIIVSDTVTNGWHDLILDVKSVSNVALKYDGKTYPSNPSMIDPLPTGTVPKGITVFGEN
jgi:hypothetical protein